MKDSLNIEKVSNGYILRTAGLSSEVKVYLNIDDLLQSILFLLEGQSTHFGGKYYGKVIIERRNDD